MGQRMLRNQRRLVMDLENLRHLQMLENTPRVDWEVAYPTGSETDADLDLPRRTWQVALLLLCHLARFGPIVQSLGRRLEPGRRMSLRYVKQSRILDDVSGLDAGDRLVRGVAVECRLRPDEARDQITLVACDFRLLPMRVIDVVYAYVPFADRVPIASLAWFLGTPRLIDRVLLAGGEAAAHFDRIRRKGQEAEAQLLAMNRSLPDIIAGEYVWTRHDRSDRQEVVEAGADALRRASVDFDPRYAGATFGEYAAQRVRDAVAQVAGPPETAVPGAVVHTEIVAPITRFASLNR